MTLNAHVYLNVVYQSCFFIFHSSSFDYIICVIRKILLRCSHGNHLLYYSKLHLTKQRIQASKNTIRTAHGNAGSLVKSLNFYTNTQNIFNVNPYNLHLSTCEKTYNAKNVGSQNIACQYSVHDQIFWLFKDQL